MSDNTISALAAGAAAKLAQGDTTGACADMRAAFEASAAELGATHPDTLMLQNDLAVYYGAAGDYAQALELAQQALTARESLLGDGADDTLASRHNVAHALLCLGRAEEAIPLAEDVWQKRGEEGPVALQAMMNLAACYGAAGRTAEALTMYEKSLAAQTKLYGERHPDTLAAARSMVNLYRAAGRLEDSVRLAKRVLVLSDEVYGATAGETVEAMQNLAACYAAGDKCDKAVKLLDQALECQRQTIGDDHPDTVATKNSLAVNYVSLGQPQKAYVLFMEVLGQQTALFGEEHPAVADALQNCAFCCVETGRNQEALEHYRRLYRLKGKLFGETAPSTLHTMQDLAMQLIVCGQKEKGFAMAQEALEKTKETCGAGSPEALAAAEMLADCYRDERQDERAVTILKDALSSTDNTTDGPETVHTILKLATVYYDMQQFDAAWELSERAATVALEVLGEQHPGTLNTMNILYSSCVQLGKFERAREVASRCLELREQTLGATHPDTLATMQHLADIESELGDYGRAADLTKEVLKRLKKTGADTRELDRVWHNLAYYAFYAARYDTVVEAGRAMLKIASKNGEKNWGAACAMQIIADGQNALGQHDKAKETIEKAIPIATATLPPQMTASQFYCTLADALAGLGDAAGAAAAARECVRLCEEAYGTEDEATVQAKIFAEKFQ